MTTVYNIARPADPLEYDIEDESLKILHDTPTMTVVSIESLDGEPLLIADIKEGVRMLRDIERFLYSFAELDTKVSHTRSTALRPGELRLITTQKEDE